MDSWRLSIRLCSKEQFTSETLNSEDHDGSAVPTSTLSKKGRGPSELLDARNRFPLDELLKSSVDHDWGHTESLMDFFHWCSHPDFKAQFHRTSPLPETILVKLTWNRKQ